MQRRASDRLGIFLGESAGFHLLIPLPCWDPSTASNVPSSLREQSLSSCREVHPGRGGVSFLSKQGFSVFEGTGGQRVLFSRSSRWGN